MENSASRLLGTFSIGPGRAFLCLEDIRHISVLQSAKHPSVSSFHTRSVWYGILFVRRFLTICGGAARWTVCNNHGVEQQASRRLKAQDNGGPPGNKEEARLSRNETLCTDLFWEEVTTNTIEPGEAGHTFGFVQGHYGKQKIQRRIRIAVYHQWSYGDFFQVTTCEENS